MANRRTQRELSNLKEELGPHYQQSNTREMSQRNRSGRGSNRSNGNTHGEEATIWEGCKASFQDLIQGVNGDNDNLSKLVEIDKQAGSMSSENVPMDMMRQMEVLCRSGVKNTETNIANVKNLVEQLKLVRAVVLAKEQAEAQAAGPSKRSTNRDSATASSVYDFDAGVDSPGPSPMGSASRKLGERGRDRDSNRDSIPPKEVSVEPQGSTTSAAGGSASGSNSKSKVVFTKGDSVAFKPKQVNGAPEPDWILGEVAQVLGEGKSRRYKVLDIEPDDQSKQKEYRSSASSMIPITAEDQASTLKDYVKGETVLALYPMTTTFYKAEVHSMNADGKVDLKFEGENDSTTLQQVERRFVIEYRP